ncbi:GNAT family N-acetyltransferase [Pseudorhodoferax soli]|uniref:GNAT family acetyltransferase n=1 Tax=Pseudorhodoferax soli TaxID=545864 RepID=A0A368XB41_9BURK|nr:GNAT family N-acetyltransferase [Pseudorhodoferax soli]RCW63637.1 GNAT family acetyltransferase [Pseudorhodoferax soli]
MKVRRLVPGEAEKLFSIHFSAVHRIAARDYSREQLEAWVPPDTDMAEWVCRIQRLDPFVAEIDGEPVGYADLQPSGYIDQFFVSGVHARMGIGQCLMLHIIEEAHRAAIVDLTSDVSLTAEPFFAANGFQVVERRFPVRRGVTLPNALMRKIL